MLGKFWRSSKVTCQYPEHSGDKAVVVVLYRVC